MKKYKCIKTFLLPFLDENEKMTDDYGEVIKGSIWEHDEGYVGTSELRMYSENGSDDFGYIDITKEHLKYFERVR